MSALLPTREQGESAVALFDAGRLDEADAAGRALIEQFPAHPLGWKIRALTLYRLGRHQTCEAYLRRAHELIPRDPDVLQVYAALLEAQGDHAGAERLCRTLLDIAPAHAEGTRLLGIVLMAAERAGEAEPYLLRAVQLAPQSALAWNSLGSLYQRLGRIEEAAQQFRRSLECAPGGAGTWSNLLLCLTHSSNVDPEALFNAHRGFAQTFETPLKPHWPHHANVREPERTLRIGFVSADLRRHAVASFLEPVLPHLARDPGLRLYAYSNTVQPDAVTARLRGHFAEWREIGDLDDAAFAQRVEADGIDILIDLSGHTGYNRLPALARKPAPVQASWIGYPGTTGLTAIDYFLADRFWAPPAQFESQFSEKIVCLPAVAPFQPEQEAPPLNALPALRNGYVTFGSFNRINKLQRNVISLWAQLLHAVPAARLKIAALPVNGNVDAQLAAWFAQDGIARERLDFHPRTSVASYLQLHHEVDIALDTFPFGGLTTALQSLWMGVPTLTWPGRTVPGRSGATVMAHANLQHFVASDAQDFLRRGAALAADLPALAELRAGMRERCAASSMFRAEAVACGVSEALRTMWRRWCTGQPPQSFDVAGASLLKPSVLQTNVAMKNFVYQIDRSPETRAVLDPGFIALDNAAQRPTSADWPEYWPIRRFLTENTLDPAARYGFFPADFHEKTSLTANQVHQFLASTPDDVDIVTFSPGFTRAALFRNMFEQAEYGTPGIAAVFEGVIESIAPGADGKTVLGNLVTSSVETVYGNYFVAKPRFWQSWLSVCEAIFAAAQASDSALARLLNAPVQGAAPMLARTLVIERIASLLLSLDPAAWKVRPCDSMSMPDANIASACRNELIELDALKLAAIHTGNEVYCRKFLELQRGVLKRIEALATPNQTSGLR
ncbi:MAG: tetratricopeptide repeat protein [Paraburkholderia sp.]|uniref:O-linked N-acetylglucosamine transferase, SPINDLY family protein n=1 Tax=Paraburkholderia sp. TaxID=1926495 RepID=UPI001218CC5F|nr:tetratricopeptide repeat protein [Paraburkholderia sp.]TAM06622.1 MAG: tetratricopeptide repeat protein [Paraburkholderia sp.]TAM28496.1 MAG: tetratricopeptide repeat protein [Paraburkholderia sp.]